MSDSQRSISQRTGIASDKSNYPRALVHKQILEVAGTQPDISMEEIADEVSGANLTLVEHVLEEYGDPGMETGDATDNDTDTDNGTDEQLGDGDEDEDESDDVTEQDGEVDLDDGNPDDKSMVGGTETATGGNDTAFASSTTDGTTTVQTPPTSTDSPSIPASNSNAITFDSQSDDTADTEELPDLSEMTTKQLETVRWIHDRPDATQAEIAEEFGVTSATICQRLSAIDGFDWEKREELTNQLFESEEMETDDRADIGRSDQWPSTSSDGYQSETEASEKSVNAETAANSSSETAGSRSEESNDVTETYVSELSPLLEQLEQIEHQLSKRVSTVDNGSVYEIDPSLSHKVAHACLHSEQISEEEELQIMKALMNG